MRMLEQALVRELEIHFIPNRVRAGHKEVSQRCKIFKNQWCPSPLVTTARAGQLLVHNLQYAAFEMGWDKLVMGGGFGQIQIYWNYKGCVCEHWTGTSTLLEVTKKGQTREGYPVGTVKWYQCISRLCGCEWGNGLGEAKG